VAKRPPSGLQFIIAAVGRFGSDPSRLLFDHYAKRLRPPLKLRELVPRKNLSGERLKDEEGRLLMAAAPKGAVLAALDARGKPLSSEDLARQMAAWREGGCGQVVFAVGGAGGLAPEVRKAAGLTLSLGAMTWPHLLVRVLLAEQLYRAQMILAGHPYHRG
jgi:23S rRNA (pseudouridine1915-N3)-methyltransferase